MQACGWPGADVQGTGCTATCWIFVRPHEAICLWSIVHLRVQAALQESPTLDEALAQRMLAAVQVGHLLLLVCAAACIVPCVVKFAYFSAIPLGSAAPISHLAFSSPTPLC